MFTHRAAQGGGFALSILMGLELHLSRTKCYSQRRSHEPNVMPCYTMCIVRPNLLCLKTIRKISLISTISGMFKLDMLLGLCSEKRTKLYQLSQNSTQKNPPPPLVAATLVSFPWLLLLLAWLPSQSSAYTFYRRCTCSLTWPSSP